MTTQDAREAVAAVLLQHESIDSGCTCGGDCGWTHGDWVDHLADALLAAISTPAQAWDEGYTSGHSNAMRRMSDEPNAPTTPNPYRAALGGRDA